MRARTPSLRHGPPVAPRTSIGVRRERDGLAVSFFGEGGGHAEILSIAAAEALAEQILDWVEFIRFEQAFGKPASGDD